MLQVRAASAIDYNPYTSGRDETIWGSDALEYRPERWLNGAGEVMHVPEGKYPQFNGGPRYADFSRISLQRNLFGCSYT